MWTECHLEQAYRLYLEALPSVVNQRATSSLCFAILIAIDVVLGDLAACRMNDCATTFAPSYSGRFEIVLLPFSMCAISGLRFRVDIPDCMWLRTEVCELYVSDHSTWIWSVRSEYQFDGKT